MIVRNRTLDIMKGIGILLVVFGHAIGRQLPNFSDNPVYRVIYTFHMPLFFFISGYVMYETIRGSRFQWLKNKLACLIIPHLIFSSIFYFMVYFDIPYLNINHQMVPFPKWLIQSDLLNQGEWFLYSLFTCFCLLLLVNWVDRRFSNKTFWIFTITLIIILGVFVIPSQQNWFRYDELKYFGPIMIMGYLVARHKTYLHRFLTTACIISLIFFPVLAMNRNEDLRPHIDLMGFISSGNMDFYLIRYLRPLCGIALVFLLATGLSKNKFLSTWLVRTGGITLGIYLFSACFTWLSFGSGWVRVLLCFVFSLSISIVLTLACKKMKVLGILLGDLSFFNRVRSKCLVTAQGFFKQPIRG
jgi:fucose 4-O-acetylase-like acetyltransferase